jgi:trigger factor
MHVTETLSDGLRRAYTVTIPGTELASQRDARLAEVGRTLRLPGFRPGRVPMALVRQRYGSSVMAEVLQESVNTATDRVISDHGLRPVGQPRVDLMGALDPGHESPADLQFKVELEILPDIAVPDVAALAVTRYRAEPADEAIDEALARLAERHATLEPLPEGEGAAEGQVVLADFAGTIDGTPFAGGEGKNAPITIGGEGYVPGFAEPLAGIHAGETRTVTVTFPETYGGPDIAGKTAQFTVTANSVNRRVTPAIDAALAERLGVDSLDALRDEVRQGLQREYDQVARLRLKRELLDQLAERANFPAPPGLVQAEFDAIWRRVEADRASGQTDEEDAGKDEDTLRREYRAIADRRVRLGLLLSEIGRQAGIQVTQDELTRAVQAEMARYPGAESQYLEFLKRTPQAVEALRGPIFEDKVVDYILELAQVTTETVSFEELNIPPPLPAIPAAPDAEANEAQREVAETAAGSADPVTA